MADYLTDNEYNRIITSDGDYILVSSLPVGEVDISFTATQPSITIVDDPPED